MNSENTPSENGALDSESDTEAQVEDEPQATFGEGGLNPEVTESELVNLAADEIDWRKNLVGFDQADVERLTALEELFAEEAEEIANAFYENLTQHDRTQSVIDRSPKGIEQLKQTQQAYWRTLTDGAYDTEYFENRARIGKLHELLEMPVSQYVGQYGFYFELLFDVMEQRRQKRMRSVLTEAGVEESTIEKVTTEATLTSQETLSVLKLMSLDMQVAMETYVSARESDLREEMERRQEIAEGTQDAVTDLKDFASEVSKSSKRIRDLTDTEAGNVDKIRQEMSTLSATVEEIASTANEAKQTSTQAAETAKTGQESAKDALGAMTDIKQSAKDIGTSARDLDAKTREIEEIVQVINDIADQTNMLALNASIEAARAGEAGEGFSVVAEEVKTLAEEVQTQAGRIEETIEGFREEIERTVEETETTASEIDDGINAVEDAMTQLDDIVATIETAADGISEVSIATDDQAKTAENIAAKLDDAAERIAEINEEIDEVAQANEQQTAKVFKVTSDLKQLADSE